MKIIRILLIIIFLAIFTFSSAKFGSILVEYKSGKDSYAALNQYVAFPSSDEGKSDPGGKNKPSLDAETETQDTSFSDDEEKVGPPKDLSSAEDKEDMKDPDVSETYDHNDAIIWPEVDFELLSSINPDVVGWIYVEGTNINYPVVQAEDNKTYLRRMFDGKYNNAGCIFLDYRCEGDFSDQHSIIYGHHMGNGSMFADLVKYKKQSFYDEHPTALLVTPTHRYKIDLFSAYVSSNYQDSWQLYFEEQEFEAWLEKRIERSTFTTNVLPDANDRILTFSTCTYEFTGAKYILHGIITEISGY